MADLLCIYKGHEIISMLACSSPYDIKPTKHSSDKFQLTCMMKDMLDELNLKFHEAGVDGNGLYVLGIQVGLIRILRGNQLNLEY